LTSEPTFLVSACKLRRDIISVSSVSVGDFSLVSGEGAVLFAIFSSSEKLGLARLLRSSKLRMGSCCIGALFSSIFVTQIKHTSSIRQMGLKTKKYCL
jgi:hypothetical protein